MSKSSTNSATSVKQSRTDRRPIASIALITACLPFFVGGILVIQTDTPPSGSPTLGMLSHALWALATVILALGVVALLRRVPALRHGLAGYLSAGVLGLAVLHGLQWVTWAYVDVRGAREGEQDVVIDSIIVPFGAGHLLMYAVLLGSGIALLGWALNRTNLLYRYVDWIGVGLGILTVGLAVISLVSAVGGGSEGHVFFDIATLLLPVLYLWAAVVGIAVYRSAKL